jgi:hypothetical protein
MKTITKIIIGLVIFGILFLYPYIQFRGPSGIIPGISKDCSLNGVTYRYAPYGGMLSYGPHLFEYYVASTDGRIKNAMMILENSSGVTVNSITKTIGDIDCNSKYCYMNLTYDVDSSNLRSSAYYVDLGCGYIKLLM